MVAHRSAATALLLLCVPFSIPGGSAAQTLVGRVLEEGRETPVAEAVITLVDQAGKTRGETTADSLGRFRLTPPAPGEYQVVAVRLGYQTTRSVVLSMSIEGSVPFEVMMTPAPVPIERLEASAERRAERLLGPFGLTPTSLKNRWIDRADIEATGMPGLLKDLIRLQNIAGVWVVEADPSKGRPRLCVRFRRGRGCALTIVNGILFSPVAAFYMDPHSLEAIAILSPAEAITFYGTEASGGAVLM